MRTINPFFLSVTIHLGIVAVFFFAARVAEENLLPENEKKVLKIMLQTPMQEEPPLLTPKEIEIPKPLEPIVPPTKAPTPPLPKKEVKSPITVAAQPQQAPLVPDIPAAKAPEPKITTAPKVLETAPSPAPKAPPPKAEENYVEENLGRIRTVLAERLKYPKNGLRLKQQGEVLVTFTLGTNRDVSNISIAESSGFEILDEAAKSLIESSASEFPKPNKPVRISVPIAYKLR